MAAMTRGKEAKPVQGYRAVDGIFRVLRPVRVLLTMSCSRRFLNL